MCRPSSPPPAGQGAALARKPASPPAAYPIHYGGGVGSAAGQDVSVNAHRRRNGAVAERLLDHARRGRLYVFARTATESKISETPGTGFEKSTTGGISFPSSALNQASNGSSDAANLTLPASGSLPSR
jgi:hypothetical protein